MFKVNDYIVYGVNGVCKVEDIEQVSIRKEQHEYYILSPVYNSKMTIKIPVENKALSLRKLMTKTEVEDLIELFAKNETLEIEDTRKKIQEY